LVLQIHQYGSALQGNNSRTSDYSSNKTNSSASEVITQATAIPGDATVVVTSEDGTVTATYTVSFSIDAKYSLRGNI
jgi:hypothetical protein